MAVTSAVTSSSIIVPTLFSWQCVVCYGKKDQSEFSEEWSSQEFRKEALMKKAGMQAFVRRHRRMEMMRDIKKRNSDCVTATLSAKRREGSSRVIVT